MALTHIIDVSNVNGDVDFKAVRKYIGPAAFLKVSEGMTFNDPRYAGFRKAAAAAGVRVGGYHFARPDLHPFDPEGEANHFVRQLGGKPGRTDLRPVLDFETQAQHLTPAQMVTWARRFNARVEKLIGMFPTFYSYSAFIAALHTSTPIGDGLWLANYGRDGKPFPVAPAPGWKHVLAHQYTAQGTLPGHSGFVDLSSTDNLNALLAHPIIGRV